ncbi:hypothetical protein PR048_030338 [Dryococelus australis]|uniref:Uncharacterized protein n=1 Tax=Dryococelus australis TaxID=614101 RepID=A0ABQ9GBK6_9NEOP|nr:hypothetical protein PR048_030338 [Dryococelus australis]
MTSADNVEKIKLGILRISSTPFLREGFSASLQPRDLGEMPSRNLLALFCYLSCRNTLVEGYKSQSSTLFMLLKSITANKLQKSVINEARNGSICQQVFCTFEASEHVSRKVDSCSLTTCLIASTCKALNWCANFKSPERTRSCCGQVTRNPPKRTGFKSRSAVAPGFSQEEIVTGRCHWPALFLRDLPFPSPLHSGAVPHSPRFTRIGSRDVDFKSRRNFFAHSPVRWSDGALNKKRNIVNETVPDTWRNETTNNISSGQGIWPCQSYTVLGCQLCVPVLGADIEAYNGDWSG